LGQTLGQTSGQGKAHHVKWSSRSAFLLAAIGAAVGLGNLWRFPYIAGENGGGAFVLIYIGFVIVLGVPLIMAELALGRAGKMSAIGTMVNMIRAGAHPFWKLLGWLSLLIPLLGLTYYSIVAGWSLDYIYKAVTGVFAGVDGAGSGAIFQDMQDSWQRMTFWHTLHMVAVIGVVSLGVRTGLETAVKFMMPALFIILAFLSIYSMVTGNGAEAFHFLFNPDFSVVTGHTVLMALGQALFSLAIGVGAMITYGAYLPDDVSIPKAAGLIALADTFVAIMAGLMIFPIVFQYGLEASEGPGLIFATMPIAFGQMTGGLIFGTLFFILLAFAAFSSALGMLEPLIAWFEDKGMSRPLTSLATGVSTWTVGILIILSFNVLKDFRLVPFVDKDLFGLMDFTVANIMLPINALLLAVFTGWVMSHKTVSDQLGFPQDSQAFQLWRAGVKYIAPVSISVVVYMMAIGNPIDHFNLMLAKLFG